MKTQNLLDDNNELDLTAKSSEQSSEWLISYSDLVTVLLCFFIMFFVIKAKQQEKDFLDSKSDKMKAEMVFSDITKNLSSSGLSSKAAVQKFDRHLALSLDHAAYLTKDGQLTLDGKYVFTELAAAVYPFMPGIQLQLSIGLGKDEQQTMAKLLAIRSYLSELGLNHELISIGSHQRKESDSEEEFDEVKIFITENYLGNYEK